MKIMINLRLTNVIFYYTINTRKVRHAYNFENNREPLIIGLEKGLGKIFKKDIEKLIETLLDELRDAFESEDFEIGKIRSPCSNP